MFIFDQFVGTYPVRRPGPHTAGKAEFLEDGRWAVCFIEGTQAGREARAFIEDDGLDVTVEGVQSAGCVVAGLLLAYSLWIPRGRSRAWPSPVPLGSPDSIIHRRRRRSGS